MKITHGKIPKILLLGNGINQAYDYASCEELFQSIRTKTLTPDEEKSMKAVLYPLQPVILTADQIDTQMKKYQNHFQQRRHRQPKKNF